jgi:HD superfamily phosphohydrolase
LKQHLELDDTDILFHIKRWLSSKDEILADLSSRFLNRRLFKVFDLDMDEEDRARFLNDAKHVVKKAGYDPNYYFREDKAGDIEYYFYTSDGNDPKNRIYAEDGFSNPRIREISEISAAVRGLQRGYKIHRVCFPNELTDEIKSLYHASS